MKSQFINELLEAESYALMLDLRDEIEDLLLNGLSVEAIANTVNQEFIVTNPSTYKDFNKFVKKSGLLISVALKIKS